MNIKKLTYRTILGAILLLPMLTACTENHVPDVEPMPEKQEKRIRWNVQSEGMADGRALIDKEEALQQACTPASDDGEGKAIGIWSAHVFEEEGNTTTEHVLGFPSDVSLTYRPRTTWDHWRGWTYGEEAASWKEGAVYYFNAYFPKEGGLTHIKNTKTAIQGNYDTETTQTDLLVTRAVVDTRADDFGGDPVALPMKHALAAIRFQFQTVDEITMNLQSFALNNGTEDGYGLSTAGALDYGTDAVTIGNWTAASPIQGNHYEWKHPDGGLPFSQSDEEKATAYQFAENTTVGNSYLDNNGYVLIIPQAYTGGTEMHFTIDNIPYQVELPAMEFKPGIQYTFVLKVDTEAVSLECKAEPWDLVETTNEFSNTVAMAEGGLLNWTDGTYQSINETDNKVIVKSDITQHARFTFQIGNPLGSTWYAMLRSKRGNPSAFRLAAVENASITDGVALGAVGKHVTLEVVANDANPTETNEAELIFIVICNGKILSADIVAPNAKNYTIIQNINI